jgi:hypothetical protein
LALRTYTSGEYRFVGGQLKRSKKTLAIRGLNLNHNHDLKNIFKGAATRAAAAAGPLQDFYEPCVARGMKPNFANFIFQRSRQVAPLKKAKPPQSLEVGPCGAPGVIIQPFGYFRSLLYVKGFASILRAVFPW